MNINYITTEEETPVFVAKERAAAYGRLQASLSDCPLTDDEIREECESVRAQIYQKYYA